MEEELCCCRRSFCTGICAGFQNLCRLKIKCAAFPLTLVNLLRSIGRFQCKATS